MESLYIKLNFDEALNSKKTLLSTEINMLNIIKNITHYKELRKQELARKSILKTRLKEVNLIIKKLRVNLPGLKGKEQEKEIPIKLETAKSKSLEAELKEIKAKLASLP